MNQRVFWTCKSSVTTSITSMTEFSHAADYNNVGKSLQVKIMHQSACYRYDMNKRASNTPRDWKRCYRIRPDQRKICFSFITPFCVYVITILKIADVVCIFLAYIITYLFIPIILHVIGWLEEKSDPTVCSQLSFNKCISSMHTIWGLHTVA